MAGGKLTPRQKMINLMYLVFIAMLALNMSKEVLTAFGLMNDKFDTANKAQNASNEGLLSQLETKASDEPERYTATYNKSKDVAKASKEFYTFIESVKNKIQEGFEREEDGKLPYEAMDKSTIDESWFNGDGYSKEGQEIVDQFNKYSTSMNKILGEGATFQPVLKDIKDKFNTADITDKEGVKKKYLDYHFKGFPAIATITKLTAIQNDIKNVEANVYNVALGNSLKQAASFSNYQAIVIPEKSAFFAGEQFKGKVVLGRYDKSTVPTKVVVNGQEVDLSKAVVDGQVNLGFTTGNVGEHKIEGKFTFMEEGKPVDIKIDGNYVVVPKPNSATISADKMNVVYRGVTNPMTISFAGISADKVNASAPGLSKAGKPGAFNMNPGSGREVTINVTGKLEDGTNVSDKKTFRIKDIPAPQGKIRREVAAKGSKSNLEVSTVTAELDDFDFELGIDVVGFNIKVPGQPTIVVSGNKMDGRARAAIQKASRGDLVIISEVKTKLRGSSLLLKKTAPCTFEIQ